MRLAAICDRDTAMGLRLAGIQELFIPKTNPHNIFNEISQRNDIGIIFITESIAQGLSKDLKDFRLMHDIPIIVEIPDKKGRRGDQVDFVSHLVKKAVGIDISKKEK
ncbi:hypothetical protein AYK25_07005 [Thermoplasmatales archaeon SM1-50]|nr:MAG: hypothetical protein AYK25_07005 [Thermoplasmatales archaeon SM1-50]